jgi:ribosomal protein L16 Arg81 hydroxylase
VAVYVTPPNAKGVKPHFDTQEGFLIQVDGSKRWKVYKPVHESPPVEGSYTSVEPERLSEPSCETVLNPGDVLYIPRGFPHEGIAGDGQASLHITLEIHVRSWLDLMSDAMGALADRDVRFRKSAPVGFLNDRDAMSALAEHFEVFKRIFLEDSSLEDALRKHVERLAVKKPPLPDGHFAVLFEKIGLETRLKKRHIAVSRQFEENGMVGLQFSGNRIVGPAKIKPALEFIHDATEFAAAELPGGLSEKERLVLVNRLIRIGLLTLA